MNPNFNMVKMELWRYRVSVIPIKIPVGFFACLFFFAEIHKLILKFKWKLKDPEVKIVLKEQLEDSLSNFETYYKVIGIKATMRMYTYKMFQN